MTPDEICEKYSKKSVGISVSPVYGDDGELLFLNIEGSRQGLTMVSELIASIANGPEDDDFSISPAGAGRFHFSKASKIGLAISNRKKL